jgi:peroxiredoxin
MKKKLLTIVGLLAVIYTVVGALAAPSTKIKVADAVPTLQLVDLHGVDIPISNPKAKWVHLQFRRFAGGPICNLYLQEFIGRNAEIEAAGIQEVVVFHSPRELLLPFQRTFPFAVSADTEKKLYAQLGVDSSGFSILDVRA